MALADYKGEVQACELCVASKGKADIPERTCTFCMGRGFVANCMSCDGKGYITQPVAGAAAGTMNATCGICGGHGCLPTNRPPNWVEPEAEKKVLASA